MKYPAGTKLKCVVPGCNCVGTFTVPEGIYDWNEDWQPVAPAVTLDVAQVPAMGRFPPQAGDVWIWDHGPYANGREQTFTGVRNDHGQYMTVEGVNAFVDYQFSERLTFVRYGSPVAAAPRAPAPMEAPLEVPAQKGALRVPFGTGSSPTFIGIDWAKPPEPGEILQWRIPKCDKWEVVIARDAAARVRRTMETGPGIAAKALAPEPWRPSVPDDFWIPDVGEHGERKP